MGPSADGARATPPSSARTGFSPSCGWRPIALRRLQATVIDALGNDFRPLESLRRLECRALHLRGYRTRLGPECAWASTMRCWWRPTGTRELIEHATGRSAKVIFEGVDTSMFCPGPKSGLMDPDRFFVFSGGKVEFRKATGPGAARLRAIPRPAPRRGARHGVAFALARLSAGFKGKAHGARRARRPRHARHREMGAPERPRSGVGEGLGLRAQCCDAGDPAGNGRRPAALARGSVHEPARHRGDGLRRSRDRRAEFGDDGPAERRELHPAAQAIPGRRPKARTRPMAGAKATWTKLSPRSNLRTRTGRRRGRSGSARASG